VLAGQWQVYVVNEVRDWIDSLDTATHSRVVQAIDTLADVGPGLGRRYELPQGADAGGATAMTSHAAWNDIRAEHVARAGGEAAVEAGKRELLAEVIGHRLAEIRRTRGLTQQQVADRMGVSKGRVSQIERGKISGQEVLARYSSALGGRLHQAIYFDDGDIAAIA
jgi:DNA-binding XRE family transcriptional regulator